MLTPKCANPECNQLVSYTKKMKLARYCSNKCKCKENARLSSEKRRQTNIKKYGTDNPAKNLQILQKMKETNLQKHGVEFHWQINDVKESIKKTNIERYGVDNVMRSEKIKNKQKNTLLERYGADNPSKIDEFYIKAKNTRILKYGIDNLLCLSQNRMKGSQLHLQEGIVEQLENKNKLKELNNQMNLTEIGDHLGVAKTTISMRFKQHEIVPKVHFNSIFQKQVKEFVNFDKTDKKLIWPYELDILIPEHDLAIECNGTFWHSELNGKDKNYHIKKTLLCEEKGIDLIHIWEHDWNNKNDICKSIISSRLGLLEKIGARKACIVNLTKKEERNFFEKNHLQGYVTSKFCIGLKYNNEIIAAMSFGYSRFNKNYEWELLRFSNKLNFSVVGAAQRLFSNFKKYKNPKSVISYCHRHIFSGNVYSQIGMKLIGYSEPSYQYIKNNKIFNRVGFQKHKLKNKLDIFDPNLTEWENMKANGYDRIWDCGNSVWIWNK